MKKLLFVFVACIAMSFASCSENKTTTTGDNDSIDTVVVDTALVDSTICE